MQDDTTVGAAVGEGDAAYAGQAAYTRSLLRFYDLLVMGYNLPVLWRCPKKNLRRLYDDNAGARHLDIGVASGYLIDKCRFPSESPAITLMDLNPDALDFAAHRLRRYSPSTHRANVLEPWGLPAEAFDSVAMSNLLHCVPGTLKEKAVAFSYAEAALAPGGTLFGATVLGTEADHTRRSLKALKSMNRKGAFCNLDDRREDLEAGLAAEFPEHEVQIHGVVALFTARKSR
jgi:SAM-dependent methyltransferase